jgi:hypothetical protein
MPMRNPDHGRTRCAAHAIFCEVVSEMTMGTRTAWGIGDARIHRMTLARWVISVALVGLMDCAPGVLAPCNPSTSRDACGCYLQDEMRVCSAGGPVPDEGVFTLPVCGG